MRHFSSPHCNVASSAGSVSLAGRSAFTIIELLVVISITSLLVALLLPALAKSRETVSRTMCLSNMRQMGIGFAVYKAEHKEWLPVFTSSINYYEGVVQTASLASIQGGDFANHSYMKGIMPNAIRACPEVLASAGRVNWGWKASSVTGNRYGYEFPAINANSNNGALMYMASHAADIHDPKPNNNNPLRFEYVRTFAPGWSVSPNGTDAFYYGKQWDPVGTRPLMTDFNSFTTSRLISSHRPGAGRIAYDIFSPSATNLSGIYPAIAGANHLDFDGSAKWIAFIYPGSVNVYRAQATGYSNPPRENWVTETGTTTSYLYWGKRSRNIR